MKIVNISQIGNKTKYLKVLGIKENGSLILRGLGEDVSRIEFGKFANNLEFFEYNPNLQKTDAVALNSLNLTQDSLFNFYTENLENGIGYFLEETDGKVNVIEYDFNKYIFKRLLSINKVGDTSAADSHIQLLNLSKNLIAVKAYNKEVCEIYLYDVINKNKINVYFPEEDNMKYMQIKYSNINGKTYLVFIKNSKSDWKMEFFIHDEWEENEEFKKYKEEKIFLVPISAIAGNDSIALNEQFKIAQVSQTNWMNFHGVIGDKIIYSQEDLKKHHPKKDKFQDVLCFYDINNQNTNEEKYFGDIVNSDEGLYIQKKEKESIVLNSFDNSKSYILPYRNAEVQRIISGKAILKFYYEGKLNRFLNTGIIIFDLEKQKELNRYYSEDEKLYMPEFTRHTSLSSKYFEKEDLLVLY